MMSEKDLIHVWGGKPRAAYVELFGNVVESEDPDVSRWSIKNTYRAWLKEIPEIQYRTDWGNWEESNCSFVASKIRTLAGGGESTGARIMQMIAGSAYKPPILTDQWTQRVATITDEAYIGFDLELVALPPYNSTVEGLKQDSNNLSELLKIKGSGAVSNMQDWLGLAKLALMPRHSFGWKTAIEGMKSAISGATDSGRLDRIGSGATMILGGAKDVLLGDENGERIPGVKKAVYGLEKVISAATAVDSIIGPTFRMNIRDPAGVPMLTGGEIPFCIDEMSFKYSPRLIKMYNEAHERIGCVPEFCEIKISIKSLYKLSSDRISKMLNLGYK